MTAQKSNFRSLDLAMTFYHLCERVRAPAHLKDQLVRAASSVALNLTEGMASFKSVVAERRAAKLEKRAQMCLPR